jgi:hypothetical protein
MANTRKIFVRLEKLEEATRPQNSVPLQLLLMHPEETDRDEEVKKTERLRTLHGQQGDFDEATIEWLVIHFMRPGAREGLPHE